MTAAALQSSAHSETTLCDRDPPAVVEVPVDSSSLQPSHHASVLATVEDAATDPGGVTQ